MSKQRKVISIIITFCMIMTVLTAIPFTASATNTAYYVDAVGGNDSNNGTSTGSAWKTLTKVNGTTFSAGDSILFKRGCTWTGTLYPKGSGASGNQIKIDAYGSGNLPLINGNGKYYTSSDPIDSAIYLKNQSYWSIKNLEVTNTSGTLAERYGIHVDASSGNYTGITIQSCKVHDVSNNGNASEHGRIAGIAVWGRSYWNAFSNVLIDNNEVYNIGSTGIYMNGLKAAGTSTNNKISNNYLHEIGGDGILVVDSNSPLVEYNVVNNSHISSTVACVAIWPFGCENATLQYNEAYNTKTTADGEGFDADYNCHNTVFQYNYGHDNEGGFFLICCEPTSWDGSTSYNDGVVVRYNIGQNNLNSQFLLWTKITNTYIYNNDVYTKPGTNSSIVWTGSRNNSIYPDETHFWNNIIYNNGTGGYTLSYLTNLEWDYNIFYGNHPGTEPSDSHKLTSDPKFVNPGSGGTGLNTCDGYKLNTGSPALSSGKVVSNNGGKDYWGNTVSSTGAPNRGAYNGAGIGGTTTTTTTTTTTSAGSYANMYNWEQYAVGTSGVGSGNIDALTGDTQTWNTPVSIVNATTVPGGGVGGGSIRALKIENSSGSAKSTKIVFYLNKGAVTSLSNSTGLRIWISPDLSGSSIRYSMCTGSVTQELRQNSFTTVPTGGGWMTFDYTANYYDSNYKNLGQYTTRAVTADDLASATLILFEFNNIPASSNVYMDDIQIKTSQQGTTTTTAITTTSGQYSNEYNWEQYAVGTNGVGSGKIDILTGDTQTWNTAVSIVNATTVPGGGAGGGSVRALQVNNSNASAVNTKIAFYLNKGATTSLSGTNGFRVWFSSSLSGASVRYSMSTGGTANELRQQSFTTIPSGGGWVTFDYSSSYYDSNYNGDGLYQTRAVTASDLSIANTIIFSINNISASSNVYMDDVQIIN